MNQSAQPDATPGGIGGSSGSIPRRMCLIYVAWQAHPQVPLFVAANRDEYHARPTAPAHWWSDTEPPIFAGRDLAAGGTWLGLTRSGRFAAITNYRDPGRAAQAGPSRGGLACRLLTSAAPVGALLEELAQSAAQYNPFSVLFSDGGDLAIFESVVGQGRVLPAGRYVLSNHLLDTPWPKVQLLRTQMLGAAGDFPEPAAALELLRDDRPAPDEALPRTGVSPTLERHLSSIFVREGTYGTRCSTLVRLERTGQVQFDEWSWDRAGRESGHIATSFMLERNCAQR